MGTRDWGLGIGDCGLWTVDGALGMGNWEKEVEEEVGRGKWRMQRTAMADGPMGRWADGPMGHGVCAGVDVAQAGVVGQVRGEGSGENAEG